MTSIRPVLEAADRALALEVKQRHTIGHLRATVREIAKNLFDLQIETGEVVVFQDRCEAALGEFVKAMGSPALAVTYVAPTAVRLRIEAQTQAQVEVPDGE